MPSGHQIASGSRAARQRHATEHDQFLFPLGECVNFEFIAESMSIFNHTNVVGLNSTATVEGGNIVALPSLGWTAALDQRLFQFGFKLTF
jgi:hypothetical protein